MGTKDIKEYTTYSDSNYYSFLTDEDFKLRKHLKLQRYIVGKYHAKKLGVDLIETIDDMNSLSRDRYYLSMASNEDRIPKLRNQAKSLILQGADLTIYGCLENEMFGPGSSALDLTFYREKEQELKNYLISAGANINSLSLIETLSWASNDQYSTNADNKELDSDTRTALKLERLINGGFATVDGRLQSKFFGKVTLSTPLIIAVTKLRFHTIKKLLQLNSNPFYRAIQFDVSNNRSQKETHSEKPFERKTALEYCFDKRAWLIEQLSGQIDEKMYPDARNLYTKQLFVAGKIIELLTNYEDEWKRANKFIPEEYYNKNFLCYVVDKKNSELTKKDVGKTVYKVRRVDKILKIINSNKPQVENNLEL
ncbi:MAG: hypothetical protein AB7S44_03130 [Spirochaetales bacterium]